MKTSLLFLMMFSITFFLNAQKSVYTTYLWHLQQPIYWPEKSQADTNHYQYVKESQDIKSSGGNQYGTGVSHPLNDLYDIFSKADRVSVYQHGVKDAVNQIRSYPNAGAQVSYSGVLIENVNSLAAANQWGYYSGWSNDFNTARSWTTSSGYPRLDLVGFTFHHILSPLVTDRALKKDIEAHKYIYAQTFGTSPFYSKGYWPAECAFSERIIKVLADEGFEWSIIANSHLSRTLNDYPLHYGTNGCNYSPPNPADKVNINGLNWWNGQIDGRGGEFAAPYCYQAHKAKYVDPATGTEYKITVVPMADLISYRDGYSQIGLDDITTNILPYSTTLHPSIVLLAHDGDNAWGGGSSYYYESVPNFVSMSNSNPNMQPTTIQQFLNDNPVPSDDLVHVEDGSWFNADNDWGHPQFINWLWPLYDSQTHEFNPNGWTEDARNWAVITAIDNYACMAEDLAGGTDIADIVKPTSSSSFAEKAWHYYLPANASCYMYYGKSLDMEVKQTIAGNNSIHYSQLEIAEHQGVDNTAPSVFIPQRFPYNPGGHEFGPVYGYKDFVSPTDFYIWTFAYDVSGLQSIVLKYRTDLDGQNPLDNNDNETYAGGSSVSSWSSVNMSMRVMQTGNVANDPEVDFFVLPKAIANLYYAEITGLTDTLVDYYVEATDNKGNVFKTPIQHVWVSNGQATNTSPYIYWTPKEPTKNDYITIVDSQATSVSKLHWGLTVTGTNWVAPIEAYWTSSTVAFDVHAVETPFTDDNNDGVYSVTLGPFNNVAQIAEKICFVVKVSDSYWDNNSGADYYITINNNVNNNPTGANISISTLKNQMHNFSESDFTYQIYDTSYFAGIRVVEPTNAGILKYDNSIVNANQLCSDVSKLVFVPANDESGSPYTTFTFKIVDSKSKESDEAYTCTINVVTGNPTSGNASVTISENDTIYFSNSNFSFNSIIGNTFAGILIDTTVNKGNLLYNGSYVSNGIECPDVGKLTYTPAIGESGFPYTYFSFKVKDNQGNYSDNAYRMTINVLSDIPDGISWYPQNPTSNDLITIFAKNISSINSSSMLHWGVNNWQKPNESYIPNGSTIWSDNTAYETPFTYNNGVYSINLGPFNNSAQTVNKVDFTIHFGGSSWLGSDYHITVSQAQKNQELTDNEVTVYPNPLTSYSLIDLSKEQGLFEISLINQKGQIIRQMNINAPNEVLINKGNLSNGVYYLRFANKEKNRAFTKRLIIN